MTGLLFVVSFLLKWRVQLFLFFTSRKEHDSNGTSAGYPPFLSVLCNLLALWLRNNFIRVKPCCNVANKMQQQCGLQDLILAPFNQNQYLITHCRYNQGVSSLDRFASQAFWLQNVYVHYATKKLERSLVTRLILYFLKSRRSIWSKKYGIYDTKCPW